MKDSTSFNVHHVTHKSGGEQGETNMMTSSRATERRASNTSSRRKSSCEQSLVSITIDEERTSPHHETQEKQQQQQQRQQSRRRLSSVDHQSDSNGNGSGNGNNKAKSSRFNLADPRERSRHMANPGEFAQACRSLPANKKGFVMSIACQSKRGSDYFCRCWTQLSTRIGSSCCTAI